MANSKLAVGCLCLDKSIYQAKLVFFICISIDKILKRDQEEWNTDRWSRYSGIFTHQWFLFIAL